LLARALLGKESSANAKTAPVPKAEAQSGSREQEQSLDEFTPPKFSWNIGNIAISAPGDNGRPNQSENRTPGGPERQFSRLLPSPIQAKLEVGAVDDPLEREADRVGEQVMRIAEPSTAANSARSESVPGAWRQHSCGGKRQHCKADASGGDDQLQRKSIATQISHFGSARGNTPVMAPPSIHDVLRSSGQPLDATARRFMEARFHYDFGGVRVHTDTEAARSSEQILASAYTVGNHVVFANAKYSPGTRAGKKLLAHELAHVIQGSGGTAPLRRQPGPHTQPDEARLRVQIVETLEATKRAAVDAVANAIERGDTAYLQRLGLSSKQVNSLLTRNVQFEMTFGAAAELAVEEGVRADPLLSQYIRRGPVGRVPRGVGKPDWVIETKSSRIPVDLMTPGQVESKLKMWRSQWGRGKPKWYIEKSLNITYQRPEPGSPMDARQGGMPKPKSPMDVHQGGMPKPKSPMDVHRGGPVKPKVVPEPAPRPTASVPEQVPRTVPEAKTPSVPSVGESVVKLAVAEIALSVLLFAVSYYLNKWHAEKQIRKFNKDLEGLWPEVNARVKNKEGEIMEKAKAFPLTYGNVTIVFTHDRVEPEDYNEGSMRIQDVAISHQNYQTPERMMEPKNPLSMDDPSYSLTFSVPLFEEKTAEKGASGLLRDYLQVRENLKFPAFKVRLSAVITLYKLAKQDSSLLTLVTRDLLGMLKDEDATVRLAAAAFLNGLKAKIAIQYLRELVPITDDDKHKELIQRYLHELEQA